MSNVDTDEKKILLQQRACTLKFAPEVGLSSQLKVKFSPLRSYIFAILSSKMNSLTSKTPKKQFSGIGLLQK